MREKRTLAISTVLVASMVIGLFAAGVASAIPVDWTDGDDNPIYDPATRAYYPDVLYSATGFDGHGPAYPYKMYYDDGTSTWLAYSNDGEEWTRLGSAPVVVDYRHPQVAYDPGHFGDDAGDLIQADFPETYEVTPYYKMWLWEPANGSRVRFAYSANGEDWRTNYPRDVLPHAKFPYNPGSPVYDLEVLYDSGAYRGWADNNGRMYNVSSSDGTTWAISTVATLAVDLGGAGEWDSGSLSRVSVVKASDTEWHLWYGGTTAGGGNRGVGHSTSSDGLSWTKSAGNPIQSLGGYGPFSGLGAQVTWNDERNYSMSVIYDPDRFSGNGEEALLKMWRSGKSAAERDGYTIGYASIDALPPVPPVPPKPDCPTGYHRIAGEDRYGTAVAASQEAFPNGADTVIVATGLNWPDALGGSALAGALDCPILLVRTDSIPPAVSAEIARLGAGDALILGGPGAVSEAVGATLVGTGLAVERLGGADRYGTADLVAARVVDEVGAAYDGTAFLATGVLFPDALSASPLAWNRKWPIYLVHPLGAPPVSTMQTEGVTDVLVLGGTGAVSPTFEGALVGAFGADHVERLAGPDRYATGVAVASYGVDDAGLGWDWLAIATGEDFPDALAGGIVPAEKGSVLLLTRTEALPPVVASELAAQRDDIANLYYLGGPGAVSNDVREEVGTILE